ncbi:MAG: serine hydrolase domain-containing protein [Planctomycetaceae bacterium]
MSLRTNEHLRVNIGTAQSGDAMFLARSISKPVCVTGADDAVRQGRILWLGRPVEEVHSGIHRDGRDDVTMQHLLSHVSGLPDQRPDNNALRARHAPLSDFVHGAIRTPLHFAPGTQYQYSSMGILLATHVAEIITGETIHELVDRTVFRKLDLQHSAQGLGKFELRDMVPVQTEHAAPESGAGDPSAKNWDWNSDYWRRLGAPWGTTHMSAPTSAGSWTANSCREAAS